MPTSLRARLLLFVFLSIAPIAGLTLYNAFEQRREDAEEAQRNALAIARIIEHDQETLLTEGRRIVTAMSQLLARMDMDPEVCRRHALAHAAADPRFLNLGALDLEGRPLCSASELSAAPLGDTLGLTGAFDAAIERRGFAMTGLRIGMVSRRPVVVLTHAINDESGVLGVVFATVSLDWVNRLIAHAELPQSATLTVVNLEGQVLVRYPDADRWMGRQIPPGFLDSGQIERFGDRVFREEGLDGRDRLFAATSLTLDRTREMGHVLIGIPTAIAYSAAERNLRRSVGLLALVGLLGMIGAWFWSEFFLLRPVRVLLGATRRLQAGDRQARSHLEAAPEELEQLASAFDEMAGALQQREEEAEQAADALRLQALVFDTLLDGVLLTDREGKIIDLNPAAEEMFGYDREELLGRSPGILYRSDPPGALEAEILASLQRDGRWVGEVPFVSKDGRAGILESVVVAHCDDQGEPIAFIGANRDVTARRRAEQALHQSELQLHHAQKMEAIGRLAGGIAHDFNNLLTAIRGNAELALADPPEDVSTREALDQIRQAATTAAALTRQMLAFSRHQAVQPQVVHPGDVIHNVSGLLGRMVGPDVRIIADVQRNASKILIDPAQLEQVLMNLAVNAHDAMPDGGRLLIQARDLEIPETGDPEAPEVPPGKYVLVRVEDSGTGMDEETRRHVFEPFFTTKEQGRGTGLGLFTVYGILRQNSAHVRVESTIGKGTVFRLYFPVAEAGEDTASPTEAEPGGEIPGGAETVLLVEDEDSVRLLALRLLERIGYRVLVARDGVEALETVLRHDDPIDLVLTDLTMPRMGGVELAREISKLRPEVPIVFMSGYTEDRIPDGGHRPSYFVQKPFTLQGLSRTIRRALETD